MLSPDYGSQRGFCSKSGDSHFISFFFISFSSSLPLLTLKIWRHFGDEERKLLGHIDARKERLDDISVTVGAGMTCSFIQE